MQRHGLAKTYVGWHMPRHGLAKTLDDLGTFHSMRVSTEVKDICGMAYAKAWPCKDP